jgi:hypothetical protein
MFRRRKPSEHPLATAYDKAIASGATAWGHEQPAFSIKNEADARAVVHILRSAAALDEAQLVEWADCVVGLLSQLESDRPSIVGIILREAVPCLLRMEERLRDSPADKNGDAWMRVMRGLTTTCGQEGGRRLIQAITGNLRANHYQWSFIFSALREGTVQRDMVFAAFRHELPPPAFLPLLLHLGKATCLADDTARHPLDQEAAQDWFESWILEPATDESTAIDAVVSLSFLHQPWAAALTGCALQHPVRQVRMEAAWSVARCGDERGAVLLAEECQDFRVAARSRAYLEELGRAELIPPACTEPEFILKTGLSRWVEDPDGAFHSPPDEIETVYRTEAQWPGLAQPATLYVMRYRVKDRWGVRADGVGFGGGASVQPDHAWGAELTGSEHAAFEDMAAGCVYDLLKEHIGKEHFGEDLREFSSLLAHWQGPQLENAEMHRVVVIDPPLPGLPVRFVVVEAEVAGARGWAVIESPSSPGGGSHWYDAALRCAGTGSDDILSEHAGRRLVGWAVQPEQSNIVRVSEPEAIPADSFIANFERMVSAAVAAASELRAELMARYGGWKIPRALGRYCRELRETGQADRFLNTAEKIIPLIEDGEAAAQLALQLSSCGHHESARALLARVVSGELTGAGDALLARARHATGDPAAAESLREPLRHLAGEYAAQQSEWPNWRKRYSQEQYDELLAALRDCTGTSFSEKLKEWRLPEVLGCRK